MDSRLIGHTVLPRLLDLMALVYNSVLYKTRAYSTKFGGPLGLVTVRLKGRRNFVCCFF
jgi:hypothetical protein